MSTTSKTSDPPKIVICLPTLNERGSIQSMIEEIQALGYDLFISDAGSTDGTQEIARRSGVPVHQRDGIGKGFGVRKAVEVAAEQGYDVLVLLDCDRTYPTDCIPTLIRHFPDYDMVVGARRLRDISFLHRIPNVVHTGLINLLFRSRLTDINSGMRALKVKCFQGRLTAEGFDIEAQMSAQALKNRLRIHEVSIPYFRRTGESKIRPWDGVVIVWRILVERFRRSPAATASGDLAAAKVSDRNETTSR